MASIDLDEFIGGFYNMTREYVFQFYIIKPRNTESNTDGFNVVIWPFNKTLYDNLAFRNAEKGRISNITTIVFCITDAEYTKFKEEVFDKSEAWKLGNVVNESDVTLTGTWGSEDKIEQNIKQNLENPKVRALIGQKLEGGRRKTKSKKKSKTKSKRARKSRSTR